jgi:cell division protein FtsI (penicillin-binding protein 3)
VRKLLAGVVERGTAVEADLATYALAGKTGTPRRIVDGRYAPSQYNPNFVGLFPADAPQLVVVVKLSNPKGNFYGGATAAPMTKTILQAALAARDAALNRSELVALPRATAAAAVQSGRPRTVVATASKGSVSLLSPDTTASPVVLDLPPAPEQRVPPRPPRSVPNVRGMTLRAAVRSLHFAGLRVQLAPGAPSAPIVSVTEPAPGVVVSAGSLVRLRHSR